MVLYEAIIENKAVFINKDLIKKYYENNYDIFKTKDGKRERMRKEEIYGK